MDKNTKIKLYYGQIIELIKSYQGKTLIGKLMRRRQDVRDVYIKKARELLEKIYELDPTSDCLLEAKAKLDQIHDDN